MSRLKDISIQLEADDADGICQSQTPSGAGALTINGALTSGGVATMTTPRRVRITAGSDESGRTFTITGTDRYGHTISESVTGPNATTADSELDFKTVTEVSVDAGTAGAVTVGSSPVGSTQWVHLDHYKTPFHVGFGVEVTGTVNYDIEHTFDNVLVSKGPFHVFNHDTLSGQTADADGNYAYPIGAMRVTINSGDGTARLRAWQAGH